MKRLILSVYVALVVVLAVTTFVEQARGTAFAGAHVYHAVWFALLWGVLAVLTLVACVRMRLWRRVPLAVAVASWLLPGHSGGSPDYVSVGGARLCPSGGGP